MPIGSFFFLIPRGLQPARDVLFGYGCTMKKPSGRSRKAGCPGKSAFGCGGHPSGRRGGESHSPRNQRSFPLETGRHLGRCSPKGTDRGIIASGRRRARRAGYCAVNHDASICMTIHCNMGAIPLSPRVTRVSSCSACSQEVIPTRAGQLCAGRKVLVPGRCRRASGVPQFKLSPNRGVISPAPAATVFANAAKPSWRARRPPRLRRG